MHISVEFINDCILGVSQVTVSKKNIHFLFHMGKVSSDGNDLLTKLNILLLDHYMIVLLL